MSTRRKPVIEAVTVRGGWKLAAVTWFLNNEESWDCDYDFLSDEVFATEDAARAAIARRFGSDAIRFGRAA